MAGRGGKTGSFTREQLQSMGVSGKEINPSIQLPPPLYPPLVNKPGPPDDNMERQYKIMWKDDFVNYLKDSPYFTISKTVKADRLTAESTQKAKEKPNFCWNLMPPELKPNFKRTPAAAAAGSKSAAKPSRVKRNKPEVLINEKLKLLEEKEKESQKLPLDPTKIKTDPTEEEEEMDEDVPQDDEMDDENDYGGNYFDNGESFNEDDDNLDDGPVY